MLAQLMFYVLAVLAVVSGLFVITGKNPVACAISLVTTLGSIAGLFVLLDAHFIATIQLLVYAGAIMVLFVFVIMLLNLHPDELGPATVNSGVLKSAALVLSGLSAVLLLTRFAKVGQSFPSVGADFGTLEQVSIKLFTEYLVPFETISILLTAAVVGAVMIAKRDL